MAAPDFVRWLDARNWPWQVHVSLALLVLSLLRHQVWRWCRQRVGARRPPTPGQVRSVGVINLRESAWGFFTKKSDPFQTEIRYSYTADGEVQEGVYTREFETEEEASEFVEGLWGRPIIIRVNPKAPDDSMVLERDVEDLLESRRRPE